MFHRILNYGYLYLIFENRFTQMFIDRGIV